MPAVSKDQQRAAAIALQAKKSGTVKDLPKGSASKGMASSMSEKELEKFAGTKHKGLPEKTKKEEVTAESILEKWEEAVFVQEEMLGVEPGEIATDKSKEERVEDMDDNDKSYKDSWTSTVNAVASHSRHPLTTNTSGARVAEIVDPNSLDLIFETTKSSKSSNQKEFIPLKEETINISRWQELAGLKVSSQTILHEMDSSQLRRYVIRMAKHDWGWEKNIDGSPGIAAKLRDDYGVSPAEIRDLKKVYDEELRDQEKYSTMYSECDVPMDENITDECDVGMEEAMEGGVSNSAPNPGHRAKMNEEEVPLIVEPSGS